MMARTLLVGAMMGVAAIGGAGGCLADVRLPAVLTSNMVIQAEADVTIWGWADPTEEVSVATDWGPAIPPVRADTKGNWRISVRTPAYDAKDAQGQPLDRFKAHTIIIKGEKNSITLENVLIGEVWVCSGQSNMEMFVGDHGGGYRGVDNWQQEAKDDKHPGIRFFDVENAISFKPEQDCKSRALVGKTTGWVECSPESVVNFSGVGYFFGREVHKAMNVPVGLIATDWGGTPAQAWTSEEGLKGFEAYAEALEWVRLRREGKGDDPMRAWWDKVEEIDRRLVVKNGAHPRDAAYDDSDWGMMTLPGSWGGDLGNFDGLMWVRRSVTIPEAWKDRNLTLSLGPIDDMDATYFDGMPIGTTVGPGKWFAPREYTIPARAATPGTHTIAVRILDTGGLGGINGGEMTLAPSDKSADPIGIGGYWRYMKSAAMSDLPAMTEGQTRELNAHSPSALFNGMIAPLTNFAIKGAIWYQGESNRGRAEEYAKLFPAMITDWRRHWGRGDFPFYYVQIAPFTYGGDKGETAQLRESQRRTLELVNTGMAVTMDIGNPADIHPSNKQDVGKRLALWAIAKTYGKSGVVYSGPLPLGVQADGKSLRVKFDHAAGLTSKGGGTLKNWEIAGGDGKFVPATARIDGEAVVVGSDQVGAPVAVRYGWCDACAPNLINGAGLPAAPFELRLTR